MPESNNNRNLTCRPWYRLHLSTWLTLLLGLVIAVFIILPGESGQYPERPSWYEAYSDAYYPHFFEPQLGFWDSLTDDNALIHGWPLPFLWRAPQGWTGDPAKATRGLPWKLTDSVREIRLLPLLVDLAVAGIGLALFAALVEWWRRMRMRVLQFSLRELWIFSALVAVALGWLNHQRAVDREVMVRLGRIDHVTGIRFASRLPLWLRTLAGDESLSWFGINSPSRPIVLLWDSERQADIQYVVEHFPHDTLLVIARDTSRDEVSAIAKVGRLEQIEYRYPSLEKLTPLLNGLVHHPSLRSLTIVVGAGSMNAAQVKQLGMLPQLESLSIVGDTSRLPETELVELRNCRKLTKLELSGVRISQAALDCLGDMPQLRSLSLSHAEFIKADLSPLSRLKSLRELAVDGTNFDDDDARQLRGLPSLRFLDIARTQVTTAGVKEMFDPSGDFAGRELDQISINTGAIDDDVIAEFTKLPRLHRITVTDVDGGLDWNGTPKTPVAPPLIPRLQKALPNCDVDSTPTDWYVT